MKLRELNRQRDLLEQVRQRGDPVCTLIAEVRTNDLGFSRQDCFGDPDSDISQQVFNKFEDPAHPTRLSSYEKLVRYWRCKKISEDTVEQLLDLLERPENSVRGFCNRIALDVGFDAFEQRSGLTFSLLRKRDQFHQETSLAELRTAVEHMYQGRGKAVAQKRARLLQRATAVWQSVKTQQLRERELPEPLVRFLIHAEQKCTDAGEKYTLDSLRQRCNLTRAEAQSLQHGAIVPRSECIDAEIHALVDDSERQAFCAQWDAAANEELARMTFLKAVAHSSEQQSVGRAKVAYAANMVEVVESVDANAEPADEAAVSLEGSLAYTPGTITKAFKKESFRGSRVPPRVQVEIIGRSEQVADSGALTERKWLKRLYFADRTLHFKRMGMSYYGRGQNPTGLRLKLECDYNGVDADELARSIIDSNGEYAILQEQESSNAAGKRDRRKRMQQLESQFAQLRTRIDHIAEGRIRESDPEQPREISVEPLQPGELNRLVTAANKLGRQKVEVASARFDEAGADVEQRAMSMVQKSRGENRRFGLNKLLNTVRKRGDAVATLIAEVRTNMGLPRIYCAEEAKMTPRTLANLEDPGKQTPDSTYERLLQFWRNKAVPEEQQEQLLDLLEAKTGGVFGFCKRIGYEIGFDEFTARTGENMNTLFVRHNTGAKVNLCDLHRIVETAFPGDEEPMQQKRVALHQKAQAAWEKAERAALEQRGLPSILIQALIHAEKTCASQQQTLSIESIRDCCGVSYEEALALARRTVVDRSDRITAFLQGMVEHDAFEQVQLNWDAAVQQERAVPKFHDRLSQSLNEQYIDNAELARAAGVDITIVQSVRDHGSASWQLPVRVVVDTVCREEVQHDTGKQSEREYVAELFERNLVRHLRLTGSQYVHESNVQGLQLYIARHYNGVTVAQLAWHMSDPEQRRQALEGKRDARAKKELRNLTDESDRHKERIRHIETGAAERAGMLDETQKKKIARGEPIASLARGEVERYLAAVEAIGACRLNEVQTAFQARHSLTAEETQFTTILDGFSTLKQRLQSSRTMRDVIRRHGQHLLSIANLEKMMQESKVPGVPSYVPALPILMSSMAAIAKSQNWDLEQQRTALKKNWFEVYPDFLVQENSKRKQVPLYRVCRTLMDANATSQTEFSERLPFDNKVLSRHMSALEAGKPADAYFIDELMSAVDVDNDRFLNELVERLQRGETVDDIVPDLKRKCGEKTMLHASLVPGLVRSELK